MIRRIVLGLAALQLVLAAVLIGVRWSEASALPAAPDVESFDFERPANALDVASGTERANIVAQEWQADARLSFVSMQVDWPVDPPPETVTSVPPFGWMRFVYVAPVDGGESDYAALSLLFERVTGELIDARVSPWHLDPGDAELLAGVQVPVDNAILAAEIAGGTDYRAACPDRRNQSIVSLTIDPSTGQPIWHIGYREQGRDASGNFRVEVNASTGIVSTISDLPAGCA